MMAMPRMRFKKAQKIFTAADNPVTQSTESNLPLMLAEINKNAFQWIRTVRCSSHLGGGVSARAGVYLGEVSAWRGGGVSANPLPREQNHRRLNKLAATTDKNEM